MRDRNNKCSELIEDIADFKQRLRSEDGYEDEDTIDRIIDYSLEILEKILESTQNNLRES